MEQNGIFISYQMAEAIELIESFDLNTAEGKAQAEEKLLELKKSWLDDTLPGTNIKIGNKITGMQDITLEEIIQISALAKQAETYTLENAGAFQYVLVTNENGEFDFDFEKLDKIAALARKNNKKLIVDSAVVFGDAFPFKIANLDKETISKLIGEYTKKLTEKYGDIIDRIDVLNAVFQRGQVSKGNNSEEFWIKTFGDNYAQEIIDIVRNNIAFSNRNIKLCWNEFYLTNSNYEQRKIAFLNRSKSIAGLDVIGIQDRFMSGESIDYIIRSLAEITSASRASGKETCITEFSCSASGTDLRNSNSTTINSKIQNILHAVKAYGSTNNNIRRIEGRVSDKFDCNHKELKDFGFEISTTGRKNVSAGRQTNLFSQRSATEIQIAHQIKQKNQIIKQQKRQQSKNRQMSSTPKVKTLSLPNAGSPSSGNKGFTNVLILSLIIALVASALFMVIYMIIQ